MRTLRHANANSQVFDFGCLGSRDVWPSGEVSKYEDTRDRRREGGQK